MSIGWVPMVWQASTMRIALPMACLMSCRGWVTPTTFDPWLMITAFVSLRTVLARASRSRDPDRLHWIMETSTPCFFMRNISGRITELCSREVVTTWSLSSINPRIARFKDSVPFCVKIILSESSPLINAVSFSRASNTTLAASTERLWPLRPGLPPISVTNLLRCSMDSFGFGKEVAALSR